MQLLRYFICLALFVVAAMAVCWSENCWNDLGAPEQHKLCNALSPDHELVNIKLQGLSNKVDLSHNAQREDSHFWSKLFWALGALGIGFGAGVIFMNWRYNTTSQLGFLARLAESAAA